MNRARLALHLASVVLAASVAGGAGAAQRTFVASNGDDVHPCSLSQPCRSFAAAISNTDPDGEVIVLDSAGYGPVTITQSVSIIAPAGIYAGITAGTGATGVTVNGSNIVVALSGLTINSQGADVGIDFIQGARVDVEDCVISNFGMAGVYVHADGSKITVTNTVLRGDFANGVTAVGSLDAVLDRVYTGGSFYGVEARSGPRVTVANSTFAHNVSAGIGVNSYVSGTADVMATHTRIDGGLNGFDVAADTGHSARLVADANVMTDLISVAFRFSPDTGTQIVYSPGKNTVGFSNGIVSGGALTTPCCTY